MDYQFENLGPERFQEFCQSLLAKAFPKLQCFPVAQPDGGRDAIAYFHQGSGEKFLVFQVKYVRKPLAEDDPHKWLTAVVEDEAPKLPPLIPKGAVEYYLLTNVAGTAHPNVGAIDRVQQILSQHLPIPAQCWWRDDLNRRLDDAWNLKWAYPELLSGNDFLRLMIEAGVGEDFDRRTRTVRAFIRDQYDRETEVKFKQVELQNQLLDLFIDVPIDFEHSSSRRGYPPRQMNAISFIIRSSAPANNSELGREREGIGAATLLLHPTAQ